MLEKISLTGKNKEELVNQYVSENNITIEDIYVLESETENKLFSSKKVSIEIII